MDEHYCVRWKGFHSNIVSALEDLKSDEEFVDVTLSCEGQTIQGHKVILSASSPYFRKILKDNPCRHPVLILNDIHVDVLEALMTYMYQGTVAVPQSKLKIFLKTAEALKIKGIVDCMELEDGGVASDASVVDEHMRRASTSSSVGGGGGEISVPHDSAAIAMLPIVTTAVGGGAEIHLPPQQPTSPNIVVEAVAAVSSPPALPPQQHPAGDLSLLATAAASALAAATAASQQPIAAKTQAVSMMEYHTAADRGATVLPSNPKRRKTAPRKLGSFLSSSPAHEPFSPVGDEEDMTGDTEKENKSLLSLALTAKDITNISGIRSSYTTNNRHNLTNSLQIKSEPMMLTAFNGAAADIVEKTAAGHHAAAAAAGFFKLERRRGTDSSAATDGPPALNLTAASQQQSSSLSSPYAQPEQKLPMLLKQEQRLSSDKKQNGVESGEEEEEPQSLDLTVKNNNSSSSYSPPTSSFSQTFHLLPAAQLLAAAASSSTSASAAAALMGGEGLSAADQLATMLGPDQMAALLGPSWKSRQPRMCQYCQRMFSNKFNLKQHVLNMHTVGREMQCEICNKKVKNKWYLRRHHVTHHGAPLKK